GRQIRRRPRRRRPRTRPTRHRASTPPSWASAWPLTRPTVSPARRCATQHRRATFLRPRTSRAEAPLQLLGVLREVAADVAQGELTQDRGSGLALEQEGER